MLNDATIQGFLFTFGSSLACILGASIVFIDVLLQKFPQLAGSSILESKVFLSSSLALASGVMFFSATYVLLPASREHLSKSLFLSSHIDLFLYGLYFVGICLTLFLNAVIHRFAPDAIDPCDGHAIDDEEVVEISHVKPYTHHLYPHMRAHSHSHSHPLPLPHPHHAGEHAGLLCGERVAYGSVHSSVCGDAESEGSINSGRSGYLSSHHRPNHEDETDREQFMKMGIQTAVAIGIHKFPEGLITFISSQDSPKLGLSIFLAISLHNVTEGLMIALPLYIATGSRTKSFLYASLLGGMSQPLGALIGVFAIRAVGKQWEHLLFGVVFAVVSGMMCVIVVKSMFPQAVKADTKDLCVTPFFFAGVLLSGLTSAIE